MHISQELRGGIHEVLIITAETGECVAVQSWSRGCNRGWGEKQTSA
jgi:hypothetical protein